MGSTVTTATTAEKLGVRCASCGSAELRGVYHAVGEAVRMRLECARCARFLRWVPEPGQGPPYYTEPAPPDAHARERAAPPKGTAWLAHLRQADGVWRPVALAATLAGAWDAVLGLPGRGDVLIVPVSDTRKAEGVVPEPSAN